jgi:hypothetical protein
VPSPILDSREADLASDELASAREILARLERYAASQRTVSQEADAVDAPVDATLAYPATTLDVLPSRVHRSRINPATMDLFPYDLAASIVGCAATILAYIAFGLPIALFITAGLVAGGESARRKRWFPSLGVNLIIGTIIGLIFVFTA